MRVAKWQHRMHGLLRKSSKEWRVGQSCANVLAEWASCKRCSASQYKGWHVLQAYWRGLHQSSELLAQDLFLPILTWGCYSVQVVCTLSARGSPKSNFSMQVLSGASVVGSSSCLADVSGGNSEVFFSASLRFERSMVLLLQQES